jgi:Flp pilus assembly protein TadB
VTRIDRRTRRAMEDALPDAARALARCYAAGLPFPVALARTADVAPDALAPVLRRATELALAGHDPVRALAGLAVIPGGRAIVAALDLHRILGGDLARALRSVADGLAAERRLVGETRVAIAQARFATRIVPTLPLVALGLEAVADPRTLGPLAATAPGRAIVIASAGLTGLALVVASRITRGIA